MAPTSTLSSVITDSKLFQPISIGPISLQHRIVLAPLTRMRTTNDFVPLDPVVPEYYSQRASIPGTLLISEGTAVIPKGLAWSNTPGIWSKEQVEKWKKVTEAVHSKKSFIFSQLFAAGRVVDATFLKSVDPSYVVSGPSDIPCTGVNDGQPIHALTVEEIKEYVRAWGQAAKNAVDDAGFDGVEVHMANGYLLDQFLQDNSNKRTDEYGGSVENRVRFPLEVMEEVVRVVGEDKVGVRLSPWSVFQGEKENIRVDALMKHAETAFGTDMKMQDPKPTFAYLTEKLKELFPNLGYLHVIEPRIAGASDSEVDVAGESNDFLREIWAPKPFISAGGHSRKSAMNTVDEQDGLIAFGRSFISNPDLPFRLLHDIPLTKYNRETFYCPGDDSGKGYVDYPFSEDFLNQRRR